MIDLFVEPRRGAALQTPNSQYRRFNRTTRYFLNFDFHFYSGFQYFGFRNLTSAYFLNYSYTHYLKSIKSMNIYLHFYYL